MDFKRGSLVIKNIKASYLITYTGQGVSTNAFYSGAGGRNGWRMRSTLKTKYAKIFTTLLESSDVPWMDEYSIAVFYNSKQDPDNVVGGLIKIMLDSLKEERLKGKIVKKGWVRDDSKTYLKGVSCFPDTTLPNNTFDIHLIHLK
jgi:hypothetical protein